MKLPAYLKAKKISESEFARIIGVNQAVINRYCREKRIPQPEIMDKIHAATYGKVGPGDFYKLTPIRKKCCTASAKGGA